MKKPQRSNSSELPEQVKQLQPSVKKVESQDHAILDHDTLDRLS